MKDNSGHSFLINVDALTLFCSFSHFCVSARVNIVLDLEITCKKLCLCYVAKSMAASI